MVSAPAARSMIYRQPLTRISTGSNNSYRVKHSEIFIDPVQTSAAGAALIYLNKPLIPISFPWLSGLASSFSKWRWNSLKVFYVPYCGTQTSGRFAMGFNYDDQDVNITTIAQIAQLYNAVTMPVWGDGTRPVCVNLDTSKLALKYYLYATPGTFNALDPSVRNSYCPAYLQVGTDAGIAGSVGAVMVEYDVELIEPIPASLNT